MTKNAQNPRPDCTGAAGWRRSLARPDRGRRRKNPRPAAAASAELRPIFATVPDIIEGKRVAEVSCARCHGANGISTAAGVPHIAAQRPPYIYTQLRAYLQGTRPQSAMTGAVKFLSDDALVKVAAYYGTLDPARPAAAPKPAAKGKAPRRRIRYSPARRRRRPAAAATGRTA